MKSLFVGNMSFQVAEKDLRALFEPFGQITRVSMPTDRETGRARGFAFVEMADDEQAAKEIASLNGKETGGRILKVNEARPKSDRAAAGTNWDPEARGSGARGRNRSGFSTEDFREVARQPREPRW